ncbi:Potassium voltage-gated channel protein Shaker [Hondaea fermentalgiana]|uniref:Potassium voltage-gated channel protein Shaker n=1 Tax=Hondaea fermentalgiana TaxID=2315210 RepID=A0A2R5GQ60_9STRA|nr:Potassium voltage-gated channel protein Shaker [Hondaea fermentalgiana]|eukprot:GBG33016.1 Potassium voltage-gated channel protein Shaker [Hondaea fermentalgiana]
MAAKAVPHPHGELDRLDFEKITLSQAATLVRSTYHTDKRREVLQKIPARLINNRSVHLFMSPETKMQLREIFDHIDADKSNSVDFEEIRDGLLAMQAGISDDEIRELVSSANGSGSINFQGFAALMFHVEARLAKSADAHREAQKAKRAQHYAHARRQTSSPCLRGLTKLAGFASKLRAGVWALVDDPASSTAARIFSSVILSLIVTSCILFMLDGVPALSIVPHLPDAISRFEEVSSIIFSFEFLLRVSSCPSLCSFARSPVNWIDLVAVIPFWLEQYLKAYQQDTGISGGSFRAVRLVRIFRVLKVGRYFRWMHVFVATLQQSIFPLGMVLLIVIIGLIIFASLVYYAERGTWDPLARSFVVTLADGSSANASFDSIPGTFWFIMSTLTTVGYGDMRPHTIIGKCFGIATAIFGILILAIPISIISTNFRVEYERMKTRQEIEQEQLMRGTLSPEQIYQQIHGNKHLKKIITGTRDFSMAAAASDNQHEHQGFAASVYKSCRANQKRVLRELRHKERDNRQDLLDNLHAVQTQYLNARPDGADYHLAVTNPLEFELLRDHAPGTLSGAKPGGCHDPQDGATEASPPHNVPSGPGSGPGLSLEVSKLQSPSQGNRPSPTTDGALSGAASTSSDIVDDAEVNELLRHLDLL